MAYKKGLGHTTGYRKDLYSYVNHLIFFYKGEVGVYECQCRLQTTEGLNICSIGG